MLWRCRRQVFDLDQRVLVMGILNVTPDSFSDRGETFSVAAALDRARRMIAAGADIVDIGGESTRPGAEPVDAATEKARLLPVIAAIRAESDVALSVDTWKAPVAAAALAAGADIINDVSGFRRDPELAAVVAAAGAGAVMMHMRGTPRTMQQHCDYTDIFAELNAYFTAGLELLTAAGIAAEAVCLDPGIGFSKTGAQNLLLIRNLDRFLGHGRPLLLGVSRKSFIGKTLGISDPKEREWGTAAAVAYGIAHGARVLRVHHVPGMRQVCDLAFAIAAAGEPC